MQTFVTRSAFFGRAVVLLLAALLAFATFAVMTPGAGATSIAVIEPEAEEQSADESLAALLTSVSGPLTTASIVFFEDNVLLPTTEVGTGVGDGTLPDADEPSLVYPWSDDPYADY